MNPDRLSVAGTPLNNPPDRPTLIDPRDWQRIRDRLRHLEDMADEAKSVGRDHAETLREVRREICCLTGMLESIANRLLILEATCGRPGERTD